MELSVPDLDARLTCKMVRFLDVRDARHAAFWPKLSRWSRQPQGETYNCVGAHGAICVTLVQLYVRLQFVYKCQYERQLDCVLRKVHFQLQSHVQIETTLSARSFCLIKYFFALAWQVLQSLIIVFRLDYYLNLNSRTLEEFVFPMYLEKFNARRCASNYSP